MSREYTYLLIYYLNKNKKLKKYSNKRRVEQILKWKFIK